MPKSYAVAVTSRRGGDAKKVIGGNALMTLTFEAIIGYYPK